MTRCMDNARSLAHLVHPSVKGASINKPPETEGKKQTERMKRMIYKRE